MRNATTTARGTCITCGDVAVAAHEDVGIELVSPVVAGDLLLCHAGIALARLEGAG